MHIYMPDPHPGRCLNHRSITHPDGYVENLRCLKNEGHPKACVMPEPSHTTIQSGGSLTYQTEAPVQWVQPPEVQE